MKKETQSLRIDRRGAMMLIGAAVPVLALSTTSAEASKMSQKIAQYVPATKNGKKCAACKFFETPHSCKVVEGNINPNGWCMLWQKA
jgi:hypothetical protein